MRENSLCQTTADQTLYQIPYEEAEKDGFGFTISGSVGTRS